MKNLKKFVLLFSLSALALAWGCDGGGGGTTMPTTLEDATDSLSYIIGSDLGKNFKSENIDVDADRVAMGIRDALTDSVKISEQDAQMFMNTFQQRQVAKQAQENRDNGKAFLDENATKEGVQVHESGLQYKIIEAGTGPSPAVTDQVTIHYRGTLIDGSEFDSSFSRGQPATFGLGNLIQAWQIALPMMKEGGKWEIYSPDNLAYGEMAPPNIGPGQTLIFYIELIKVGGPAPGPPAGP